MVHAGATLDFVLYLYLTWRMVMTQKALEYRVLEEKPSGTVIGNILIDSSLHKKYQPSVLNSLTFSFLTKNGRHSEHFTIETRSGIIKTVGRLDRDTMCTDEPECLIRVDLTIRPIQYFQVIKVRIFVLDINDNWPTFPKETMQLTMSETKHIGVLSVIPGAIDIDIGENSIQGYRLSASSPLFSINTASVRHGGGIQIILNEPLDREVAATHQLRVIAYDGGTSSKSGSITLKIIVMDANDNIPKFENETYEVNVLEDSNIQQSLIKISASDADEGENGRITYKFSAQSERKHKGLFGIDENTGVIYLKDKLKYQKHSVFQLSVIASDNGADAVPVGAQVRITVVDVNDHAPDIRVHGLTQDGIIQIKENGGPNAFVAHLSVEDQDGGQNGKFSCDLLDEHFDLQSLDATEYKIVTAHNFDREATAVYQVQIDCRDHGSPPISSQKQIIVSVADENDHAPVFSKQSYFATLYENNNVESFIVQVNATDTDAGRNARVSYIVQDVHEDTVRINSRTGVLVANVRFDREEMQDLEIVVLAVDQGDPAFTATATVLLTIQDRNDEMPRFTQPSYGFHALENQPSGSEVGKVFATDLDSDPYNKFTYSIVEGGAGARYFTIDGNTGSIRNTDILHKNVTPVYRFIVVAADSQAPWLRSTANVSIYVVDGVGSSVVDVLPPVKTTRNLLVILSLSGALLLMLLILISVVIIYTRRRRRLPDRSGYISGNLVRVTRRDADFIRAKGELLEIPELHNAWGTLSESIKRRRETSENQDRLTTNKTGGHIAMFSSGLPESNVSQSGGNTRNHQADGAPSSPDGTSSTLRGSRSSMSRTPRVRQSRSIRDIDCRSESRIIYNRAYGLRSSVSAGRDLDAAARRGTIPRRDSDSACSADVSHSDSGNCFSDDAENLQKRDEGRAYQEKHSTPKSSSREQRNRQRHRPVMAQTKTRRYQTESLSSPDSEGPMYDLKRSPSPSRDEEMKQSNLGPHRVALVHPQRTGDQFGSDCEACDGCEQLSLSDSCRGLCGSDEEGLGRRGRRRGHQYEFQSDSESGSQPAFNTTGLKRIERHNSPLSDNSDKTLVSRGSNNFEICANDTDFYESDNEFRSRNIVV